MKNATQLVLLACLVVVMTACGKKQDDSHSDSQVVAKVNDAEISVHQLNFQLARLGKVDEKKAKQVAPELLKRLVNQEILKQQAIKAELDRDPRVLQAIEASKTEILAQAYLERELAKANKPTVKEVDAFYEEHPGLFSERRLYKLQEIAVITDPSQAEKIANGIQGLSDINQIAQWLKANSYQFTANTNVRAAEQLPLNLLSQLYKRKDGEYVIVNSEKSINIVHIGGSESKPVSRDQATPMIEQYYLNQARSTLAKQLLETESKNAKVEYMGEFAASMKAKVTTLVTNASEVTNDAKTSEQGNEAINKGLSGF